MEPASWTATVVQVESLTADVRLWRLRAAVPMAWKPGQYVTVQIPVNAQSPATTRDYSIACVDAGRGAFELVANLVPNGRGTPYLFALQPGDTITCTGPKGHFVIDDRGLRDYLFVATGTGIVPLRAMIQHLLQQQTPRTITLYWGLRTPADCYWRNELQAWQSECQNFSAIVTLSQPTQDWRGAQGYVTEHIARDIATVAGLEAYVCGNAAMIADVKAALKTKGLCPVKMEKFY